jgi:large subunit ribosomal protein L17
MRTMVTEFLENEKMITTVHKAKEVRSTAEKMITLGKRENLSARRRALSFLRKKSIVFKLFDSLAPRFADRQGGYTRILRLGPRVGDGAEMALLQFVDDEPSKSPKSADSKKSDKKAAKEPTEEKKAKAKSKSTASEKSAKSSAKKSVAKKDKDSEDK